MATSRWILRAGVAAAVVTATGVAISVPRADPLTALRQAWSGPAPRIAAAAERASGASSKTAPPSGRSSFAVGLLPAAGATVVTGGPTFGASAAAVPAAASAAAGAAATGTSGGLGNVVVRRVEQDASVTLRVKDVGSAFNAATALDAGIGGYVESSTLVSGDASASGNLVLAVPQASLPSFLRQIGTIGTVLDTQITGQDVTAQYVDLQGRLQALEAERQSYLTLLGQTTAIGDILQIQAQLTDVESQIEDLQGQINQIDQLSAMAQVTLTLQPPAAPAPRPAPAPTDLQRIGSSLAASLRAMASGATDLGLAMAWLCPWALLGGAGYAVYRRMTRVRAD